MKREKLEQVFGAAALILLACILVGISCVGIRNRELIQAQQQEIAVQRQEIAELTDTVEHLQYFVELNIGKPVWK